MSYHATNAIRMALSLVFVLAMLVAGRAEAVTLKVAIGTTGRSVALGSGGVMTIASTCRSSSHTRMGIRKKVVIAPVRSGFRVRGKTILCTGLTITSPHPISYGGKRWPGSLLLLRTRTGIVVVNRVDLEDYIAGVIVQEMAPDWPLEALKAQAVASRSYALYRAIAAVNQPYHLDNSIASQVYEGHDNRSDMAHRAVAATRGLVAIWQGEVAQTYYHSASGGSTENVQNVWPGSTGLPYLTSRPARYEQHSPDQSWRVILTEQELRHLLRRAGHKVGRITRLKVAGYYRSGRASYLYIYHTGRPGSLKIRATRFRHIVGTTRVRSTRFTPAPGRGKNTFILEGSGYGHGVGMSQYSARGMAEAGWNYRRILANFYPGVTIEPLKRLRLRLR